MRGIRNSKRIPVGHRNTEIKSQDVVNSPRRVSSSAVSPDLHGLILSGQLQPRHSRASAGLTAIDAGIAGSTWLHEAAAGDARRRIADVVKELRAVGRTGFQSSA
jgi:hypothetical protein